MEDGIFQFYNWSDNEYNSSDWTESPSSSSASDSGDSEDADSGGAASQEPSQEEEEREQQNGTELTTIGDAVSMLRDRFRTQIQSAYETGAALNAAVRGDAEARAAFYTLLPLTHQRQFFLELASQQRNWPRLRSLFGAPPYAFLLPQDAGLLNATGIARARVHIAYEDVTVTNYNQFGSGQFVDDHEREYRVVDATLHENDLLPSIAIVSSSDQRVELIVRVRRRSKMERVARLKDPVLKKTISFPMVGEVVALKQTKRLLRLQNRSAQSTSDQLSFKILQVRPRGASASTAAILALKT